eukprot:scaffold14246_cov105-Isochrysis_galbana.AAC.15
MLVTQARHRPYGAIGSPWAFWPPLVRGRGDGAATLGAGGAPRRPLSAERGMCERVCFRFCLWRVWLLRVLMFNFCFLTTTRLASSTTSAQAPK